MPLSHRQLRLRSEVDSLDGRGLTLDRDDLLILLACTPQEDWDTFINEARTYRDKMEAFLSDYGSQDRFKAFARCLLTLAYGGGDRVRRFVHELFALLPTVEATRRSLGSLSRETFRADILYELYVDLFAADFDGLIRRLDYLQGLGVTCLWLLPFLDSPNLDAGFDQRNRYKVQERLGGNEAFGRFAHEAKKRGLSIMMDLVINHRSSDSERFREEARPLEKPVPSSLGLLDEDNSYFIWAEGDENFPPRRYQEAAPRFEGTWAPDVDRDISQAGQPIESIWSWHARRKAWFLHSFLPQQPDVNYKNPAVLLDDLKTLRFWLDTGIVRYVRLDAIPILFKMDEFDIQEQVRDVFPEVGDLVRARGCVELPQVLLIVRLLSAFLLHAYGPDVAILSETNSEIKTWLKYYGDNAGSRLNYQFYRMQALWASLARGDATHLAQAMALTTNLPSVCSGILFARIHDELNVENADPATIEAVRDLLLPLAAAPRGPRAARAQAALTAMLALESEATAQGAQPASLDARDFYSFGRGISARQATLLRALAPNPALSADDDWLQKHQLLISLILSMEDIPLIYMGDEWGESDHWCHLVHKSCESGGMDTRNLHRAIADPHVPLKLAAADMEQDRAPQDSLVYKAYAITRRAIWARRSEPALTSDVLEIVSAQGGNERVLAFTRSKEGRLVLVLGNFGLATERLEYTLEGFEPAEDAYDLLSGRQVKLVPGARDSFVVELAPRQSMWLLLRGARLQPERGT